MTLLLLCVARTALAFDVHGVSLGDSERRVREAFPNAYCRPLEWRSSAAQRRCDDGKSSFAGVGARVTFYLKGDQVRGVVVAFDAHDRERVAAYLKSHYGTPVSEQTETIRRRDKADRKIYKAAWRKGTDSALLTVRLGTRYGRLEVSRGDFAQKIYEVD